MNQTERMVFELCIAYPYPEEWFYADLSRAKAMHSKLMSQAIKATKQRLLNEINAKKQQMYGNYALPRNKY